MTRQPGSLTMQSNIEPRMAAPFDARTVVPAKDDLTEASNFPYAYVGMIVSVQSEGKAYMLTANDVTVAANWKEIGTGGGGSYTAGNGIDILNDVISIDDTVATKDKFFVATYNVTTAQELRDYLASTNEPAAPILVKRGNDYYTALLAAASGEENAIVRVLGSGSGDYYVFNYTVTGNTWASSSYGFQKKLESGTNIKTINGESILGEGDLTVGGSGGVVGEDFTTNIEVGGLESGTAIAANDTITSVLKKMLVTTYYPTYVSPSANLSYSASTLLKVGATIPAASATVTFNPGAIMLEGVKQNNRAGAATNYTLATSGATTDYNNSNTTGSFSVTALTRASKGNITMTATVTHEEGPQPLDSDGNDYESPLPAGSVTTTKTFEFINPFYWGVSNNPTISDFTGLTEDVTKKGQKQYTYVTNDQYMVIAYEASYGNLTSILDPNNFETIGAWNKSSLTVGGVNYNVYVANSKTTATAKYTFKF